MFWGYLRLWVTLRLGKSQQGPVCIIQEHCHAPLTGNNQSADFLLPFTHMIVMQVRVGFCFHIRENHLKSESRLVKLEETT